MPETNSILKSQEGAVTTLSLNIPERHNALSKEAIDLFSQYLSELQQDDGVRVLIITGRGEKTFCAGAALDQLNSGVIDGDRFTELTDQIAAMPMPTICSFNGSAYGGGAEIGLACDFRIGITNMNLFVPPARIGLCYPINGIARFVQALGINTAKRLLIASEEFSAETLLNVGYLTHLVEPDSLATATTELAQRIAGYAPLAINAMKKISNDIAFHSFDQGSAQTLAEHCNQSSDLKEGLRAMNERRAPRFKGE